MAGASPLQLTLCDELGQAAARFGSVEFERLRLLAERFRRQCGSPEMAARMMNEALERFVTVLEREP